MTVAACCKGGYRLTYHVPIGNGQPALSLTIDLPMDGTEVPTLSAGKPTGQTMSATRVDDHHCTGVIKQNGQPFLTSKVTLAADGRSMTVEDMLAGGDQKVVETSARSKSSGGLSRHFMRISSAAHVLVRTPRPGLVTLRA